MSPDLNQPRPCCPAAREWEIKLCSRYHDPDKGNEYIDKDTVKYAIGIPEEVFEKAVKEFVDPGAHDCVEVEMPTLRLRLGTGGLRFCEAGTNPFT